MSEGRKKLLRELPRKLTQSSQNIGVGSCFTFGNESLTRPQVDIMFFVASRNDGVSVKDIAEEFHVTSGAVTQLVDVLAAKKLLTRQEDKHDRRGLKIMLTKKASQQFAEFEKSFFSSLSETFSELSDNDLTSLIQLLSKVKGKYCDVVKGGECNG